MAGTTDELQSGYDGKVSVEFYGKVAVLTMDCGENRANKTFAGRINKALDQVLENDEVKALVTTGVGKYYSNGLDVGWLTALARGAREELEEAMQIISLLSARILAFPIPTIAAINGHCYAFGAVFSLCHDYRIMQTGRGWWCLNEIHRGLGFVPATLKIIRAKLPVRTAHVAAVLGKVYTGESALQDGIVHSTSRPGDLLRNARDMATKVLPKNGYVRENLAMMKEGVYGYIGEGQRTATKHSIENKL